MREYKALKQNVFEFEDYKLIPIRYEDRIEIMKWRNEQMFHLRQSEILTLEKQDFYFQNTVSKLFEVEKPNQLLFSFFKDDKLIGYGGLVHINWQDKNAEISFLIDTELNQLFFDEFWFNFLIFIKKIAFENLNFLKIFTYAFDVRPELYIVLEKSGFKIDATYKNHVIINSKVRNVVVHAIFNKNIELIPVNFEDSLSIYEMSIEEENRKNSFNSNFFTFEQHSNWFKNEILKNTFFYKVIISENVLLGQVRITNNNLIGITIEKQFRGLGFSDLILNKATDLFFKSKLNENSIFAYIKSENIPSIKAFIKGGFEFQEEIVINNIESKKYIKKR